MKRALFVLLSIVITAVGCSQQRQEKSESPVVYPGAVTMISPDQIRQLEDLAKQAPKNANAWITLGNALMDSKRFSEAVDAYGKALTIDPKNVDVRVDMGTCLRSSGKPQQAIEEFRKAIKIKPNHLYAHLNSGVVLTYDLQNKKEGIKEFEKYLALAPNAPNAEEIRRVVQELKSQK